ncbi:hypothetical protein F7734_48905 [Scytonema sp. UIC 10036]|uniref:hypothetical protein n=1 Tax=Scytonema sp. UIC 10036 TaxID=2304196 RepID=UPI0012DA4671|nr:hypothetical protein [Scytonema sp. UIC 10036]MUG99778.1 hypothetical protein [Scytonema sp. UIC 10036]
MTVDKVRIKKYQQSKVEQWSQALDIPVAKFIEDAIGFYLRYLEGKQPVVTTVESVNLVNQNEQKQPVEVTVVDVEEPEDFDGGIEL